MSGSIGQLVGSYRLVEEIGAGNHSRVYRAVYTANNGPAAIRLIAVRGGLPPGALERFQHQANAFRQIRSDNVVDLYEFGHHESQLYLATELGKRGSLRTLLQQAAGPLSPRLAIGLVRNAADGLHGLHGAGIIHGGLTPEKIVLQAGGADAPLIGKIADFGDGWMQSEGGTGEAAVGSLAYTAPEQWQGLQAVAGSDLYALGAILYELLTGYLPFEARTVDEAVYKHNYTQPIPPRQLRPELPQALEDFILRCLVKRPEGRFRSASEMSAALGHLVATTNLPPIVLPTATAPLPPPAAPAALAAAIPDDAPTRLPDEPIAWPSATGEAATLLVTDASGAERTATLTTAGLTVGRAPTNSLILEDPTVSRRHAEIAWDGRQATIVDVGSSAGSQLGDENLPPNVRRTWLPGTPLRIGTFRLRLQAPQAGARDPGTLDEIAAPPPVRAAAPAVIPIVAPIADSGRIRVIPEQTALTLTPGVPAALRLTLANVGTIVDHLTVSVEGVPEGWIAGGPPTVQLNREAQAPAALTVLVPPEPSSYAGEYPIRIRVSSRANSSESAVAEGLWTVLPFDDSRIEVEPKRVTGRRAGRYLLSVTNQGNQGHTYPFEATDDEHALSYQFTPPELFLPPGGSGQARLSVGRAGFWFGTPVRRTFTVSTYDPALLPPTSAEFVQVAALPAWLAAVPGLLCIMVGLLAAAFVFLFRPAIDRFEVQGERVAGSTLEVLYQVRNTSRLTLSGGGLTAPIALEPAAGRRIIQGGLQNPDSLKLEASNPNGFFGLFELLRLRDERSQPVAVTAPSPTVTQSPTASPTGTIQPSATPTASPTGTQAPSATPTGTAGPTRTPVPSGGVANVVPLSQGLKAGQPPLVISSGENVLWMASQENVVQMEAPPNATPTLRSSLAVPAGTPLEITAGEGFGWVAYLDALLRVTAGANPSSNWIVVGTRNQGVTTLGGAVWLATDTSVGNNLMGAVIRITPNNPAQRTTIAIAGKRLRSIAGGKNFVWVGHEDGTMTKINPANNTVVATFTVKANAPVAKLYAGSDTEFVWAALRDGTLAKINPTTNAIVATSQPLGDGPRLQNLTATPGIIWVAYGDNKVVRVNPENLQAFGTSTVAPAATTSGVAAVGGALWVAASGTSPNPPGNLIQLMP